MDGVGWLVKGQTVGLRAPTKDEFVDRWVLYNDPRLTMLTAFPTSRSITEGRPVKPPVAKEHREALWDTILSRNVLPFDIHVLEDGRFVGEAGLSSIEWPRASAEIAVCIFDAAERANGYGSEAVVLLLSYGFDALGLERMYIRFLAVNEAVVGAAEKTVPLVGGRLVGVERQAEWAFGDYRDRITMECLRADFPPQPWTAHLRVPAATRATSAEH
jgi:RimJ/RimL family protein N-acetyltransferase